MTRTSRNNFLSLEPHPLFSIFYIHHTPNQSSLTHAMDHQQPPAPTTQLQSACKRFFNIAELVLALTPHLDRNAIAKLCQINRRMYTICIPNLYAVQDFFMGTAPSTARILNTPEATSAFARNIQNVHRVTSGPLFASFYYNCLLLASTPSQDLEQVSSGQLLTGEAGARKEGWVSPPSAADPRTAKMIPIGPMTNLVSFTYHAYFPTRSLTHSAFVPSTQYPKTRQAQIFWILQQCPHLTSLKMDLLFAEEQELVVLARTLPTLCGLKKLDFTITADLSKDWSQLVPTLVFSAPASLEWFDIGLEDLDEFYYDQVSVKWSDQEDQEKQEDSSAAALYGTELPKVIRPRDIWTSERRQELPLMHLRQLHIASFAQVSPTDMAAIFAHCPALVELHLPDLENGSDVRMIAGYVGESCPRISQVFQHGRDGDDQQLTLEIVRALEEQTLQVMSFSGLQGGDGLISEMLQRHSTVLRELRLADYIRLSSKSIQKILSTGRGLEVLRLEPYRPELSCITLEDAAEVEWVCKEVKHLRLEFKIGATIPPSPDAYYKRVERGEVPLVLTKDERAHFSLLETLYRQVGALVKLEHLDMRAVAECSGDDVHRYAYGDVSFPGMLSLGDEISGRPGYLDLFGGLKMLRSLNGSVRANTDETRVTVGQQECEWLSVHWPLLEDLDFCSYRLRDDILLDVYGKDERTCFRWLKECHPKLNLKGLGPHM